MRNDKRARSESRSKSSGRTYGTATLTRRFPRNIQGRFVSAGQQGFPKMLKFTHKMVQQINLVCVNGGVAVNNIIANGMADPDPGAPSPQPLYFDQLTALYARYTVIGSKITFTIGDLNATNQTPGRFGIFINDDNVFSITDADAMAEQPSCVFRHYNKNSAPGQLSVTAKWSAKKTFGGSVLNNPSLGAAPTANPTEQSLYTLWIKPYQTGTTESFAVFIKIEYIAIWTELKEQGRS